MASTRFVLAVLTGLVFTGAVVAQKTGSKLLATWLLAFGSVFGTVWAGLSFAWSENHATMVSSESYFALAGTSAAMALFFFQRGIDRDPLGE